MKAEFNPDNFNPKFETVGCFIEYKDKIIAVHRHPEIRHGDMWGLPSGMMEKNETPEQAIIREIKEETGLIVKKVKHLKTYKVRYSEYDFLYHLFKLKLDEYKELRLNTLEHHKVEWLYPKDLLDKKLIPGFHIFLKEFYDV